MKKTNSFLKKRPVFSVVLLSVSWLVLVMLAGGITSFLLDEEFGNSKTTFVAHVFVFICVFVLLWKSDWLQVTGINRFGSFRVWLLVIAGTVYMITASLYSFYGIFLFDFSGQVDSGVAMEILWTQIAVCLNEEFFFRGLILYILIQSWGSTNRGKTASVILMSAIFAIFHGIYLSTSGISILLLVVETFIISVWWASLVLVGKSIWPAVFAHFIVNTVISIQGISISVIQPEVFAFGKVLLFSIALGILAFLMISKAGLLKDQ